MNELSQALSALALGALQGVTEFLPISSDGHIALFGFLVDVPEMSLALSTRRRDGTRATPSFGQAFAVGIAGIAVLPGVSRSALTIACALAFGMSAPAAFRFSFLLAIPVIAGAIVLKLGEPGVLAHMSGSAWLAAATSFVVGFVALRVLGRMLTRGHFWLFSLYLVPLGAAVLALSFFGA